MATQKAFPPLSLNVKITPQVDAEWVEPPTAEALELMKKQDPPLQHTWALWEQHVLTKEKASQYADATKQTVNFATVKEFWSIWNHIPQPSELLDGKRWMREQGESRTIVDCLMIFRKGIRPEWEDPANARGGHFQLLLKPTLGGGLMDEIWNSVVLAMIGGAIEPAEMISGVRIVDKLNQKIKPGLRLELWFNDMDESETGKLYKLKGSFEQCMRTTLDGTEKTVSWGYTETKPHGAQPAAASRK